MTKLEQLKKKMEEANDALAALDAAARDALAAKRAYNKELNKNNDNT
jgi:hypothetical protein